MKNTKPGQLDAGKDKELEKEGKLWEVEVAPDPHSGEKTHQPTTMCEKS